MRRAEKRFKLIDARSGADVATLVLHDPRFKPGDMVRLEPFKVPAS